MINPLKARMNRYLLQILPRTPQEPHVRDRGGARLIGKQWRSVRQTSIAALAKSISTIRRNFPQQQPPTEEKLVAGFHHNYSGLLMRYGACRVQGEMGLAASRAESFTRMRDMPLSQNEGT